MASAHNHTASKVGAVVMEASKRELSQTDTSVTDGIHSYCSFVAITVRRECKGKKHVDKVGAPDSESGHGDLVGKPKAAMISSS